MIQRWDCNTFSTINKPADDGEFVLFADHASEVKVLREALEEACQSLQTISSLAGKPGENLEDISQVRGYANSRAEAARTALGSTSADRGDGGSNERSTD